MALLEDGNGDLNLEATVERIVFQSEDTGFVVARVLDENGNDVTIAGNVPLLKAGQRGRFTGSWGEHPKFGRQFKAEAFIEEMPVTGGGMEKYLGSGLVKGIGREFARRLVEKFGDETLKVISSEPHRLSEVEGIGKKRIKLITGAWEKHSGQRDVMVFLQGHGIGPRRALKIYRTYGDSAISLIKNNPYRLASEIWGVGFKLADKIARSLGFAEESVPRARAAVLHLLHEASAQGHCYLTKDLLFESALKLKVPGEVLSQVLDSMGSSGPVVLEAGERIYLAGLYRMEIQCASLLRDILNRKPPPLNNPDALLDSAQKKTAILLAPSQRQAVIKAMESRFSIITGGPGVGKTSILKVLAEVLKMTGQPSAFCAPTGRAAKRMSQAIGCNAYTIHRLFGFKPQDSGIIEAEAGVSYSFRWLVIDEASMMDLPLFHGIMSAVSSDVRIVLVGDSDQLPSVGPGQVLADLIGSGLIPVTHLTQIFRQKEGSLIVSNAHRINRGRMPVFPGRDRDLKSDFYFIPAEDPDRIGEIILNLVAKRIPDKFGFNRQEDIQVLSPMRHRKLGTGELNETLRQALNPNASGGGFYVNDRVMQIRNNYDKQVFNGDMGRVAEVLPDDGGLVAEFDGRSVQYDLSETDELVKAYAITVHKSQGSEFPAVVMPLYTGHYVLLQRNLLYTAITRARNLVVLVGSAKALHMAVSNNRVNARNTTLKSRLTDPV